MCCTNERLKAQCGVYYIQIHDTCYYIDITYINVYGKPLSSDSESDPMFIAIKILRPIY